MAKRFPIFGLLACATLLCVGIGGTVWFNQSHVGWLIQHVEDVNVFQVGWQNELEERDLQHPAVIHVIPDDCLCKPFMNRHALAITTKASKSGYKVYQTGHSNTELGQPVSINSSKIAPLIIFTNEEGRISYLGAYSDGIRCNEGTSLVDQFLNSPTNLPPRPVVGLDVKTCFCKPS